MTNHKSLHVTKANERDTTRTVQVDKISGQNTARVFSYRSIIHPLYKKRYTQTDRILADTRKVAVHVGDVVRIQETRPVSKRKAWEIVSIVKAAPSAQSEPQP